MATVNQASVRVKIRAHLTGDENQGDDEEVELEEIQIVINDEEDPGEKAPVHFSFKAR